MDNNPYQATAHDYAANQNDISASELQAFAGGEHYPRVLMPLIEGKARHAGFNVWAALFGVQWFFFRKLYMFGLFALALEMIAPSLAVWAFGSISGMHPNDLWAVAVMLCFLATRVLVGYMANIALGLKAVSVIGAVDALNKDNETHLRLIRDGGGVSLASLLFMFALIALYRSMG